MLATVVYVALGSCWVWASIGVSTCPLWWCTWIVQLWCGGSRCGLAALFILLSITSLTAERVVIIWLCGGGLYWSGSLGTVIVLFVVFLLRGLGTSAPSLHLLSMIERRPLESWGVAAPPPCWMVNAGLYDFKKKKKNLTLVDL